MSLMRIAAFVCLALAALGATAAPITGRVVAVADGDTITVLIAGKPVQVRLADIDAPEKCQESGVRAKTVLTGLVLDREVQLEVTGTDRYGRSLARVSTAAHGSINAAMIDRGAAWVFRRYGDDPKLIEAEERARRFHVGLWADASPMAPWEWRQAGLGCGNSTRPAYIPPVAPESKPPPLSDADAVFRGFAERSEQESLAAAYGGVGTYGLTPYGVGTTGSRGPIRSGPRGGQYYVNNAGNKQYVKR